MKLNPLAALAAVLLVGVNTTLAAPYDEPWRPQYHFTPARNWMNDPNGLVYYEGEYHLFYQYNPFGDKWGHMSWGHSVSRDLVHWQHLPLALAEENGVMIFSGSAVVDWKNTSGFGINGKPPLIAIYTGHYTGKPLQNQQIAYSNDKGRTWTKYAGNPVIDIGEADFRDPKVFWHEPTRRWVMVVSWSNRRMARLYSSPDLKSWTHLSDFGPAGATAGIWECPDLFEIKVKGGRGSKWVLIVNVSTGPSGGAGTQYFVGDFDGTKFIPDPKTSRPQPAVEIVPEGRVLADFEDGTYGGWKATGDAFGTAPAQGTLASQQSVDGFRGKGLVNSYRNGDGSQGMLVSPEFTIDRDYLNFLVGGGRHAETAHVDLVVDGRVVRTATGADAERLSWTAWQVGNLRGKTARIEIVDKATGGWGHINADHFMLADKPAQSPVEKILWADYGQDYYAAVSWSDMPKRDGRRVWIGWMNGPSYAGDVPTSPWRSAMSVPRTITVRETTDGYRMFQEPVRELDQLRSGKWKLGRSDLSKAQAWLAGKSIENGLADVELELDRIPNAGEMSMVFRHGDSGQTKVDIDFGGKFLRFDRNESGRKDFNRAFHTRHVAPLRIENGRVKLRMLVDVASVEVFGQDGETVMTEVMFPAATRLGFNLTADHLGQSARIRRLEIRPLRASVPIPDISR